MRHVAAAPENTRRQPPGGSVAQQFRVGGPRLGQVLKVRVLSGEGDAPAGLKRLGDFYFAIDLVAGAAKEGHDGRRGRGLGVPRLLDVLERYPSSPMIVEMKDDSAALAERTVETVRAAGAAGRVVLGSFLRVPMRRARAMAPDIPTSATREEVRRALRRSRIGWNARRRPYQVFQVPQARGWTRVLSPRFVRAAHGSGIVVQVWTVDDEHDMRRLLSWGVDAIITDRPDVAVRVVRGGQGQPNAHAMPTE